MALWWRFKQDRPLNCSSKTVSSFVGCVIAQLRYVGQFLSCDSVGLSCKFSVPSLDVLVVAGFFVVVSICVLFDLPTSIWPFGTMPWPYEQMKHSIIPNINLVSSSSLKSCHSDLDEEIFLSIIRPNKGSMWFEGMQSLDVMRAIPPTSALSSWYDNLVMIL